MNLITPRHQACWAALRLNSDYRKAHDVLCQWILKKPKTPYCKKKKNWSDVMLDPGRYMLMYAILPYEERELKRAIKKRLQSPFSKDKKAWNESVDDLVSIDSVSLTEPSYCDNLSDLTKVKNMELRLDPDVFESVYNYQMALNDGQFNICFNIYAEKKAVIAKVNEAFSRINALQKPLGIRSKNPKFALLQDAFDVYELHRYQKKSLSEIAKKRKFSGETYNAAYNRIKKQLKTAHRMVHK